MEKNRTRESDKYHYSHETQLLTVKDSGHVYLYIFKQSGLSFTPVGFDFPPFLIPVEEAEAYGDAFEMMADIDAAEIEMRELFTLSDDGTRLDVHATGNWYSVRSFEKGYAFAINGSVEDELIITEDLGVEEKAYLHEYCTYVAEVIDPNMKTNTGGVSVK